jgi:hypothetical protein
MYFEIFVVVIFFIRIVYNIIYENSNIKWNKRNKLMINLLSALTLDLICEFGYQYCLVINMTNY